FAPRMKGAKREDRFYGATVPNYFRKPYGPGWALVGDAGYNRDFITAQGIQDAFRDAELCAGAIAKALAGAAPWEQAMADYQQTRDAQVGALYELTAGFATQEPPSPQMQQLMGAVHGNQAAMDDFTRVIAGVKSPAEFFSEENVGRIFAAAQSRSSSSPQAEQRPRA
ncbi:MAG TPA: oxidoreductase, partial [Candidatus Krumholzibacteria bacterium]